MSDARAGYLGVDLGTSGLKLTLVGVDGCVLSEAEASYDVRAPHAGFAESDPADWVAALERAGKELVRRSSAPLSGSVVEAIGFTGQMHGVVLTDQAGHPTRPAVLWPDQRAAGSLQRWLDLDPEARARLANPLFAGMAGPVLSWLQEHEPAALTAATLARSPKDWLRATLTGDQVTERSDASATLLWDVVADDWSPSAVALAGLSPQQLPRVMTCDAIVGRTTWPVLDGLVRAGSDGVPVVAGGADTACALAGVRAATKDRGSAPDGLVINVGTGVQILRPDLTATRRPDPVTHLYADVEGGWYEMVAIQNGGLALSWAQRMLGLDWDEFVAVARSAPPGSGGVSFVPFLTGERGGVAAPRPNAGWVGATDSTGRSELARSAFEALAFTVRRGIELLDEPGGRPATVSGGGARDPWVRQLLADVLGRRLSYVPLRSASAVGAAVLAARGVDVDLPVVTDAVEVAPSGPSLEAAYQRWSYAVDATAAAD